MLDKHDNDAFCLAVVVTTLESESQIIVKHSGGQFHFGFSEQQFHFFRSHLNGSSMAMMMIRI